MKMCAVISKIHWSVSFRTAALSPSGGVVGYAQVLLSEGEG